MTSTARNAIIAEVRRRLAEFPGASGWTPHHFDAMLQELDALMAQIDDQQRRLLEAFAKVSELAVALGEARQHNGFEDGLEFAAQIAGARGDPRVAPYIASEIRKAPRW